MDILTSYELVKYTKNDKIVNAVKVGILSNSLGSWSYNDFFSMDENIKNVLEGCDNNTMYQIQASYKLNQGKIQLKSINKIIKEVRF